MAGEAGALPIAGSVETNAAEAAGKANHHIAPDERPHSGMDEEQGGAAPNLGDSDGAAIHFEPARLERPNAFRKPSRAWKRKKLGGGSTNTWVKSCFLNGRRFQVIG